MERLNALLFIKFNREIKDELDVIVILKDTYVNKGLGYPKAIGYVVEKNNESFNYEFKSVEFYGNSLAVGLY